MLSFNWQKLKGGNWGVLVSGQMDDDPHDWIGRNVEVTAKSGRVKNVTLAALVMTGENTALFTVAGKEGERRSGKINLEPGYYELDNERYWVRLNAQGTRTYAMRFNPVTKRYDFASGMVYKLRPEDRVEELVEA
jgi:hypothetical protein